MTKRNLALSSIVFAALATGAIAQTTAPTAPSAPASPSAPAATAPAANATVAAQNVSTQGKWRASKLMGVDVYGPDNKKVGDVTEVLFDKTGRVEAVTVGVGGFLGMGAKDVAIPFAQVVWSDTPMTDGAPMAAPASGGTATTSTSTMAGSAAKAPAMYPDHGKITMTKEQLTAAPAVTYSDS